MRSHLTVSALLVVLVGTQALEQPLKLLTSQQCADALPDLFDCVDEATAHVKGFDSMINACCGSLERFLLSRCMCSKCAAMSSVEQAFTMLESVQDMSLGLLVSTCAALPTATAGGRMMDAEGLADVLSSVPLPGIAATAAGAELAATPHADTTVSQADGIVREARRAEAAADGTADDFEQRVAIASATAGSADPAAEAATSSGEEGSVMVANLDALVPADANPATVEEVAALRAEAEELRAASTKQRAQEAELVANTAALGNVATTELVANPAALDNAATSELVANPAVLGSAATTELVANLAIVGSAATSELVANPAVLGSAATSELVANPAVLGTAATDAPANSQQTEAVVDLILEANPVASAAAAAALTSIVGATTASLSTSQPSSAAAAAADATATALGAHLPASLVAAIDTAMAGGDSSAPSDVTLEVEYNVTGDSIAAVVDNLRAVVGLVQGAVAADGDAPSAASSAADSGLVVDISVELSDDSTGVTTRAARQVGASDDWAAVLTDSVNAHAAAATAGAHIDALQAALGSAEGAGAAAATQQLELESAGPTGSSSPSGSDSPSGSALASLLQGWAGPVTGATTLLGSALSSWLASTSSAAYSTGARLRQFAVLEPVWHSEPQQAEADDFELELEMADQLQLPVNRGEGDLLVAYQSSLANPFEQDEAASAANRQALEIEVDLESDALLHELLGEQEVGTLSAASSQLSAQAQQEAQAKLTKRHEAMRQKMAYLAAAQDGTTFDLPLHDLIDRWMASRMSESAAQQQQQQQQQQEQQQQEPSTAVGPTEALAWVLAHYWDVLMLLSAVNLLGVCAMAIRLWQLESARDGAARQRRQRDVEALSPLAAHEVTNPLLGSIMSARDEASSPDARVPLLSAEHRLGC